MKLVAANRVAFASDTGQALLERRLPAAENISFTTRI
jgi:hypothetical protein